MKVIEILNFNKELLNRIQNAGIRLGDCRYIELYDEYKNRQRQGEKITYIVTVLADKYGISERKVYDLVKRFESNCKLFAV
ncbi:MAG: hypothetical protein LBQ28_07995 [Prevotellaceae bacterium]|jgi:hypothetical protein|nr:hypothetical protein [Prevotellaceae bacterium]